MELKQTINLPVNESIACLEGANGINRKNVEQNHKICIHTISEYINDFFGNTNTPFSNFRIKELRNKFSANCVGQYLIFGEDFNNQTDNTEITIDKIRSIDISIIKNETHFSQLLIDSIIKNNFLGDNDIIAFSKAGSGANNSLVFYISKDGGITNFYNVANLRP